MKRELKFCIVIPAYDEAVVIKNVVSELIKQLRKTDFTYEVVVVNDGSKDNTSEQVRAGGAKVINHIQRTGQIIDIPEATTYEQGLISREELLELAEPLKKSRYGEYLARLANRRH